MDKLIEIRQQKNKEQGRKPKCYNCNRFGHMAKDCKQPKKEKKRQGCFKYGKEGHITEEAVNARGFSVFFFK